MEKEYYTYEQLTSDMRILAEKVKPYNFEVIVPITRGGLAPACHLGYLLNIKNFQNLCLSSYEEYEQGDLEIISVPDLKDIPKEKILIVDSMVDRGTTLMKAKEFLGNVKFLTIHVKPHTIAMPDFYMYTTSKWIVYPWDYEG